MLKTLIVFASGAVLSGCCTGVSTDPREGGFAGGVCGGMTGAYDQRIFEREKKLSDLDAIGDSLNASIAENEALVVSLDDEIVRTSANLSSLRENIDELQRLYHESDVLRVEIGVLKKEQALLEALFENFKSKTSSVVAQQKETAVDAQMQTIDPPLPEGDEPAQMEATDTIIEIDKRIDALNERVKTLLGR